LILDVRDADTPTPVFLKKRLQPIENKGEGLEKERQESLRGGKRLEGKEIEEVEEVKGFRTGRKCEAREAETKAWRVLTRHDTKNYRNCQYIKLVLVFKDWAQGADASRDKDGRGNSGG
jgi:hypothetical protein